MASLLRALLVLFVGGCLCIATGQESTAKDRSDVCHIPVLELQNLTLVELRESHRSESKVNSGLKLRQIGFHKLLERIYKHQLLLPEALLQRAISNLGDLTRIEHILQKLAKGNSATVVALGGSVSAGHGVHDPENGWISRVFAWLEEAFPDTKHRLLNHAIPAVTSGYISACVPELIPDDTDLVILEFTYNDWVFSSGSKNINDASRRGLERLLRRLLAHSNRPAIIYLHYWPAARFLPSFFNDEDLVDSLLKYYGIPTLSMRNALHGLLTQTPALLDQLWWPTPDPKIHPTCVGARMMADLVIGYLQHLAGSLQDALATTKNSRVEAMADRQPFLLEGNWGHTHTACVMEEDFPALVSRVEGWAWADEGKTRKQHKWGYISLTPGNTLDILVPFNQVPGNSSHFLVGLGGLISYQHMGSMALSCSGGCSCPPIEHNMFHDQRFSMTGWRYVNVTRTSRAACMLTAANSKHTSTGEHKLKLSSLMISAKGETVAGTNDSMLAKAMTNLNSSRPLVKAVKRTWPRQHLAGRHML